MKYIYVIVSYILRIPPLSVILNMEALPPPLSVILNMEAPTSASQPRYPYTITLLGSGVKKIYAEDMVTKIMVNWPLGSDIKRTKQPNGCWCVEYKGKIGYLPENYNF